MRSMLLASLLVALVAGTNAACSSKSCTDIFVCPTYWVSVDDYASGKSICDATVSVDPAHSPCGAFGSHSSDGCTYLVAIPDNSSTATLTASAPGYSMATKSVSTHYPTDDCGHAVPVPVTIELTKQ